MNLQPCFLTETIKRISASLNFNLKYVIVINNRFSLSTIKKLIKLLFTLLLPKKQLENQIRTI